MANSNPRKPKKDHPWKNAPSAAAVKWAREESQIRGVNNLSKARSKTLKRKTKGKQGQI